jgi:hypothetical protein
MLNYQRVTNFHPHRPPKKPGTWLVGNSSIDGGSCRKTSVRTMVSVHGMPKWCFGLLLDAEDAVTENQRGETKYCGIRFC